MNAHSQKMTRKQEAAVSALLGRPTISEAASEAGISESTLHRWLKDDAFQAAYRAARRQVVQQAIGHLQRACTAAVAVLMQVMADKESPASARVSAARTILEHSFKAVEIEEIEQRLDAVEQTLFHKKGMA